MSNSPNTPSSQKLSFFSKDIEIPPLDSFSFEDGIDEKILWVMLQLILKLSGATEKDIEQVHTFATGCYHAGMVRAVSVVKDITLAEMTEEASKSAENPVIN